MKLVCCVCVLASAVLFAGVAPAAGANLLANPGFEQAPYGSQTIPGWTTWGGGTAPDYLFDGVFDSSWHVPPTQAGWPSNFGASESSHFLGRYYEPSSPSTGWLRGAVYQRLTGRTPGETLYAQCWVAAHHPHGPAAGCGCRIGLDPTFDPAVDTEPSADVVWYPEKDIAGRDIYGFFESAYGKLNASAVVGPAGTMTMWLQYQVADNDISEPQIVQVDGARLATDRGMEIDNVAVIGVSATSVKIVFDTYDGATLLPTNGFVDYGATAGYGSTGTDASNPRANHEITLTGLTAGATYHFRCRGQVAGYENAETAGLTFVMMPSLTIANRVVNTVTGNSARIEWDTTGTGGVALAADSRVEYGYTNNNYQFSKSDPALVTHHSVTITGLYPNTKYYFRVVSTAPNYNSNRSPSPPFSTNFVTAAGEFWNGGFETVLVTPRGIDDEIPGWLKVGSAPAFRTQWFNSNEWNLPAKSGGFYAGNVTNFDLKNCAIAQKITTTPGQLLSFSAWVWSESSGDWKQENCPGQIHRFGETAGLIGIDPTGGTDATSQNANTIWSAHRQTQDWQVYAAGDPCALHTAGWQKIGVSAVATGTTATVFLKSHIWYGVGWSYVVFDDVAPEPVTDVASIADAKTKDNDTAISLQPANNADCPIVTYIANPNPDSADNHGAPYFYAQDPSRAAGIKVTVVGTADIPANLTVGDRVKLKGCITWGVMQNRIYPTLTFDQQSRLDKPCGERVIRAYEVTVIDENTAVDPLGMGNKGVAGGSSADHWFTNPGAAGAVGENTVGLLARTWGKIVAAGYDQNMGDYIVIDDGSAVPCFSGEIIGATRPSPDPVGLYVFADNDYSADIGKYAVVTGISAVRVDFDWDDPSYVAGAHLPEAMKNVRFLKSTEIRVIN